MTVFLLLALALLGSALASLPHRTPAGTASPATMMASANDDLALYRNIDLRVSRGENYYAAAATELRADDYPLRPFAAFRLPTLATTTAALGLATMTGLQLALFGLMAWAWWRRLDGQFVDPGRRTIGAMLALAGVAFAFSGQYVDLHEVWAGTLIAISLAFHRDERWGWSLAAAALALSIRELALPYVLLMGGMALIHRQWREAAAWSALVVLFAVGMTWHAAEVAKVVLPSDPASPGWTTLAGWDGLVRTFHLAGPLRWLPAAIAMPILILGLFGWLSWRSRTGLTAFLLYLGYALAFMLFGRANNFYWGIMVAPAFLVGLAFVPGAISDLRSAIRGREG